MPIGFKKPSENQTTTQTRTGGLYDTGGSSVGGTAMDNAKSTTTNLPRPTQNPNIQNAAFTQQTFGAPGAAQAANQLAGLPTSGAASPATGMQGLGGAPLTGFASQYTPADVLGMNQMPARYLYDILAQRGMDPTGGLFYMMEPLADIMMPLFEVLAGSQTDVTQGFQPGNIANFMGGTFEQMMTPGGAMPDVSGYLQTLLGGPGLSDQGSILYNYLNTGTPEEQVENLRRYMMLAGQLSGSPMYQQALSNTLSQGGYDYLNQFQGGQQPDYSFRRTFRNQPGF